ncbi:MAG: glycosyltransferase [Geobacteraceae bacterium]|nr:glycosyltransferase [Geobacteraceae bacterium]
MQKAIIIPCYNEVNRLNGDAFLLALEKDTSLSFYFVNDGSTDGTLDLLESLKYKNSNRINIISLINNSGKAEAVRIGILNALSHSYDYVGYWDADLATPLDAIDRLIMMFELNEIDIVIGSRVRLMGRNIERRPFRHYLGRIFATVASLILKLNIYDTQCGAKLFKCNAKLQQVFSKKFKVKWLFDVEMLARFAIVSDLLSLNINTRWIEYPLEEWFDVKGSKIKKIDYLKCLFELGVLTYYLYTPAKKNYVKQLISSDTTQE